MMDAATAMASSAASPASPAAVRAAALRFSGLVRRTAASTLVMRPGPCALRIDEGLHRGAVALLRSSPMRIGSSPDNDVVLRDAGVLPVHAELRRLDGTWRLCVPNTTEAIPPHRSQRKGAFTRRTYLVGAAQLIISQPARADEASEWTRGLAERLGLQRLAGLPWKRLAAPAFFALAVVCVAVGALTFIKASAINSHPPTRMLDPQGWPDVRIDRDRSGVITVRGFVRNAEEAGRLRAWLRSNEDLQGALVNVRIGDDLVQRVRGLLPDKSLQASYAGSGVVRVAGTSTSKALREEIQRLNSDLSDVVRIEDAITYKLPPEPPTLRPLPFRISGVSPGPNGSFGTDSGARYFVGSVLNDGAEVMAVRSDEIEFKLGQTRIFYPLK
jgi:Inner membrane component of T3SS, cytoplasmic domain